MKLCIVDTKAANFNSVVQAFKRLDVSPEITRDISKLKQADKLILPGVGSASAVMRGILGHSMQTPATCCTTHPNVELSNATLEDSTNQIDGICPAQNQQEDDLELLNFIINTRQPVLGICLGMQVLTECSQEVPLNSNLDQVKTLGLIPGVVHKLDPQGEPLPHMGWNTIRHNDHPLFAHIAQDTYFYFVHSFCVDRGPYTIAQCTYGQEFSAAIAKDNFMGVQFHPEKSGAAGAKLLQNFLNL